MYIGIPDTQFYFAEYFHPGLQATDKFREDTRVPNAYDREDHL